MLQGPAAGDAIVVITGVLVGRGLVDGATSEGGLVWTTAVDRGARVVPRFAALHVAARDVAAANPGLIVVGTESGVTLLVVETARASCAVRHPVLAVRLIAVPPTAVAVGSAA